MKRVRGGVGMCICNEIFHAFMYPKKEYSVGATHWEG